MNEKKWPFGLSLVWWWLKVYPRCWLLVVFLLEKNSRLVFFLAWCWLQVSPRCWLLDHIHLFYCCFSFVLVVLYQYLVSEQTSICLKHHRNHEPEKYLKKKKIILCPCFSSHLITIQIHKKPAPPSASITSSVPITPATSNFVV